MGICTIIESYFLGIRSYTICWWFLGWAFSDFRERCWSNQGNHKKVAPTDITVGIYISLLELTPYGKVDNNLELFSGDPSF